MRCRVREASAEHSNFTACEEGILGPVMIRKTICQG